MQLDRNGLEVLSREECLRLLAQSRVGRVVVTDRALPAAFPVNFALLDEDVVFMTTTGSKLEAAEGEEVMAFEADDIDPVLHSGWSVLVQGLASVISDPAELEEARALRLEPWAPAADFQFVRIRSELVSGRRLLPTAAPIVAAPAPVTHTELERLRRLPVVRQPGAAPGERWRDTELHLQQLRRVLAHRRLIPPPGVAGPVPGLPLQADVHRGRRSRMPLGRGRRPALSRRLPPAPFNPGPPSGRRRTFGPAGTGGSKRTLDPTKEPP